MLVLRSVIQNNRGQKNKNYQAQLRQFVAPSNLYRLRGRYRNLKGGGGGGGGGVRRKRGGGGQLLTREPFVLQINKIFTKRGGGGGGGPDPLDTPLGSAPATATCNSSSHTWISTNFRDTERDFRLQLSNQPSLMQ